MGEFPFQISPDKVKKVVWQTVLVAIGAAVTYLLNTVIPTIDTSDTMSLMVVTIVVAVLNAANQWVRDNRSPEEIKKLPYKEYLRQRRMSKR